MKLNIKNLRKIIAEELGKFEEPVSEAHEPDAPSGHESGEERHGWDLVTDGLEKIIKASEMERSSVMSHVGHIFDRIRGSKSKKKK
tara:strand:- start:148 stop:405 length:258 start_codon:yes stop_codon:yes gene_type:complete